MDLNLFLPDYLNESPYGISISESISRVSGSDLIRSHPPLPSKLNENDCAPNIEVVSDGMEAIFKAAGFGDDRDASSVRADYPIPKSCGIYYFEVTIISVGVKGFELHKF